MKGNRVMEQRLGDTGSLSFKGRLLLVIQRCQSLVHQSRGSGLDGRNRDDGVAAIRALDELALRHRGRRWEYPNHEDRSKALNEAEISEWIR